MIWEALFWLSAAAVIYPYALYPIVLWGLGKLARRTAETAAAAVPRVSMIVPVHNERAGIGRKIENTRGLRYPKERLEIFFVSDGSTDGTLEALRTAELPGMQVIELPARKGKAAALNAGLARARHDILVFSDASIELEPDALERIVGPFADPRVGCVSGEDRIPESGGEGLYGRYELMVRRLESRVHSIVGASGSFYAQRRALCAPFVEGMAPDFLSVLRTVDQGSLAKSEPSAVGFMSSVKVPGDEYRRKVRTLVRGMTALFAHGRLLNPLRFGPFAFSLASHKVMRWLAPLFLAALLAASAALAARSPFYLAALAAQVLFYACAAAAHFGIWGVNRTAPGKIALYFSAVNVAAASAWFSYLRGVRQELWTPSRRQGIE